MIVYVAGPLGTPWDWPINVAAAVAVGNKIIDAGHVPIVPHLAVHLHKAKARSYEEWLALDFKILARCDALYRMPGVSPGADREVAEADKLGIPVVYTIVDLDDLPRHP